MYHIDDIVVIKNTNPLSGVIIGQCFIRNIRTSKISKTRYEIVSYLDKSSTWVTDIEIINLSERERRINSILQ